MRSKRRAAALAGAAGLLMLALCPPAEGRRHAITGTLDKGGYTVVALAIDGTARATHGESKFKLVPPTRTVTLQLRDRRGDYAGPVILAGRSGRVTVGVRSGAKLGRIEVLRGYARTRRPPKARYLDTRRTAKARHGAPIGALLLGRVRSSPKGPPGAGRDQDHDGVPGVFDLDDDGDLVLDVNEPSPASHPPPSGRTGRSTTALRLSACPEPLCHGQFKVGTALIEDADASLVVAIAAAILALVSLGWQAFGTRRVRRRRVVVDLRLGLPIYQEGGGDWAVFVEVVNQTEHPVRWVSAALEMSDGRRMYLMQNPPGGELPAVLQPHESRQTWTRCHDLEQGGMELTEPIVAAAKLDTGEILRSPRRRLASRSLAERLHLSRTR
jgi:hypothetical protein